jgi:hypothetical protein
MPGNQKAGGGCENEMKCFAEGEEASTDAFVERAPPDWSDTHTKSAVAARAPPDVCEAAAAVAGAARALVELPLICPKCMLSLPLLALPLSTLSSSVLPLIGPIRTLSLLLLVLPLSGANVVTTCVGRKKLNSIVKQRLLIKKHQHAFGKPGLRTLPI